MKDKQGRSLSLSNGSNNNLMGKQEKIEISGCPRNGINCVEHRSIINQKYIEADRHLQSKDYQRSIEALKNAYYKATDLKENTCQSCAELFRLTITQSLEEIHADLRKMTTGFFKSKRFKSSYELATTVLEEIKKVK